MLQPKERVQAFDQQIEAAKAAQEKASHGQTHVQQQLDDWNPELAKFQDALRDATAKLTQATEAKAQYLKARGVEQTSQQANKQEAMDSLRFATLAHEPPCILEDDGQSRGLVFVLRL